MTPLAIRTIILEVLAAHLGVYTKTGNPPMPAIWVGPSTPPGWSAQGLEVVIFKTPEPTRNWEFDAVSIQKRRRVVLRQHDTTKDLEAPIDIMLRTFRDTPAPTVMPETDLTVPQATLFVVHNVDL